MSKELTVLQLSEEQREALADGRSATFGFDESIIFVTPEEIDAERLAEFLDAEVNTRRVTREVL
ncbi:MULTISPECIES: hypothetical protein [Haloferax]|uniref:Uncharacterized protein n=2 Tax=Haloferax TaxID=2251 RepID=M0IDA5_HALVO|nr:MULTISPECIES: hypothetical protein [Haloferax]ELZ93424.1 hypothetical protein C452_04368 [Haloferax alexandrinus JCM 10717]MDS0240119.1 hypothetical protein [Haloferax sp. S2CR25]MDS0443240.1 hypothetical protein [Haloferax sp. S2CR25-2]RDZ40779.1 hypothetical protein C5B89_02155 [Haloferax sp. Atlit-47N]REA05129.1 hypothetical protein DEQ92_02270 [Haloferax sp. Atlit-6N]